MIYNGELIRNTGSAHSLVRVSDERGPLLCPDDIDGPTKESATECDTFSGPAAGIVFVVASIGIKLKFVNRAIEQQSAMVLQQGYILALALSEVAALFGLLDYFITGNPFYYANFIVAACGQLYHFPRRQHVLDASFRMPTTTPAPAYGDCDQRKTDETSFTAGVLTSECQQQSNNFTKKKPSARLMTGWWPVAALFVAIHAQSGTSARLNNPAQSGNPAAKVHPIRDRLAHYPKKPDRRCWSTVLLAFSCCAYFAYVQTIFTNTVGQYVMPDLRRELYEKLQRQEVAFYDRNPVGRVMTRLTSDVDALNELFTSGVTDVLGDLVMIVAIISVMMWMDVRLTVVTLLTIPMLWAATTWFRKGARRGYDMVRTRVARITLFRRNTSPAHRRYRSSTPRRSHCAAWASTTICARQISTQSFTMRSFFHWSTSLVQSALL
jgi:ABC-type multidrug transport system fused ATPase/permease subunit